MAVVQVRENHLLLCAGGIAIAILVGCSNETPFERLQLLDLTGRPVDFLEATNGKATVFLFTRTDCPISNRYAPVVRRIYEKFAPRDVTFWLIYLDRDEPVETIHRHMKEYDYRFGALRDLQHALVELTQAQVTPEAAVFVPGGRMVYRGRIDNRYVAFGKTRPEPTKRDLELALDAVLAGKPVTNPTTTAVGCFITDLQ